MSTIYKDTDSYKVIEGMDPVEVEMMVKVWQSIKHTVNAVDPEHAGGWSYVNDTARFEDVRKTVKGLPGHAMSNHRDRRRNGFKYRSRAWTVRLIRKDLDKVKSWAMDNDDGNEWVGRILKEVDKMVGYLPHNAPGEMDDEDATFYFDSSINVLTYLDEWKTDKM